MHSLQSRLLIRLLIVLAFLCHALPARAQNFTNVNVPVQGQFATIVQNQKFLFYQAGVNGNNVAYVMAIQPGSAITVYVTAKSATFSSTDTLNVNFFTNGNPTVRGCSNGGSYVDGWTAQIASAFINGAATGTPGSVAHLTFATATTAFVTTGILNASQVCVQIVNNATGGANDTFDMYASFTPNALPTGGAVGGAATIDCTGNIALVAGAGVVQPVPCDTSGNSAGSAGFYLGSQTGNGLFQDLGNWLSIFHGNNGTQNGGLGVVPTGVDSSGHARTLGVQMNQTSINVSGGSPPSGVLVATDVGMMATHIFVPVNSTTQQPLTNSPTQAIGGIGKNCNYVQSVTGSITGTGPTLDTYIQESVDNGATWIDRVHFLQVTAVNNQRAVTINDPAAGLVPVATTDRTLAAGTVINGPLTANLRVAFVVGGTTPSFGSVGIYINCD